MAILGARQGVKMKAGKKGSLQRTMILYFLLISFASSVIGAEFIADVQRTALRTELIQNFEKMTSGQMSSDEAFRPIEKIRNKAILMIGLFLFVVIILLTMFIRNITGPLQHMATASRCIASGDLSLSIDIQSENELAEIGNMINELTSNFQEVVLLSKDMCDIADQFMKETSELLSNEVLDEPQLESLHQEMNHLKSKIEVLSNIIMNCKFYRIEK
jgi:methyl-accepting chemotaxis protein